MLSGTHISKDTVLNDQFKLLLQSKNFSWLNVFDTIGTVTIPPIFLSFYVSHMHGSIYNYQRFDDSFHIYVVSNLLFTR